MALSKSLVLRGILGVAAICGAAGGGAYYYSGKDLSYISSLFFGKRNGGKNSEVIEEKDVVGGDNKENIVVVNEEQIEDNREQKAVQVESIVSDDPKEAEETTEITKTCPMDKAGECELDSEQLNGVKFSPNDGSTATISGTDKVMLTIEDVSSVEGEKEIYTRGKKYTFSVKEGTLTIKGSKSGEITITKDKGSSFKENDEGQLEYVPEEDSLGIPTICLADRVDSTTPRECQLTEDQIKKIKFVPKVSNGSISVSGLSEGNKVTLKIEIVSNDSENYPKNKKYIFKAAEENVKITGIKGEDIDLGKDGGITFRENNGNQLEWARGANELGIPDDCREDKECELWMEDIKKIKFKDFKDNQTEVEGLDGDKSIKLKVEREEEYTTIYPKGKKYTFTNGNDSNVTIKNNGNADIQLNSNKGTIEFREVNEGNYLERTPSEDNLGLPIECKSSLVNSTKTKQSCSLSEEQIKKIGFDKGDGSSIGVDDLGGDKVELTIEYVDDSSYVNKRKYTFKSTAKTIKITGIKGGDVELKKDKGIEFREVNGKLEKVPTEDAMGIPITCQADKVTGTQSKECSLTEDQLKKVKFKALEGGDGDVKVEGLNGTIKLKISHENDASKYPNNKKYTLINSSNSSEVKISKGNKSITIAKKTDSYFKEEEGKLVMSETKLKAERTEVKTKVNAELGKLNLHGLNIEDSDFNKEGKVDFKIKTRVLEEHELKKIPFKALGGAPKVVENFDSKKKVKIELFYTSTPGYSHNLKFVFTNTNGGNKDIVLKNSKGDKSIKIFVVQKGKVSVDVFKVVNGQLSRA